MDISARLAVAITDSRLEAALFYGFPFQPELVRVWAFKLTKKEDTLVALREIDQALKESVITIASFSLPSNVHEQLYIYGNDEDVKAGVYRDLKRDFEIELKNSWVSMEAVNLNGRVYVYAASMPVSVGNFYFETVSSAKKMKINAFETFNISVKRGIHNLFQGKNVLACFSYGNRLQMMLVRNRRILAFRRVDFLWKEMVNKVAKSMRCSFSDAVSFLRTKGFEKSEDVDESVYITIAESIDPVIDELQRMLDYVRTYHEMFGAVDKVVLMGDLTGVKLIDTYMEQTIDISVIKSDFSGLVKEEGRENSQFLDILIGAASRRVR